MQSTNEQINPVAALRPVELSEFVFNASSAPEWAIQRLQKNLLTVTSSKNHILKLGYWGGVF